MKFLICVLMLVLSITIYAACHSYAHANGIEQQIRSVKKEEKKNILNIIGTYSPTALKTNSSNTTNTNEVLAKTKYETSVGLLYQRRLGKSVVGGLGGTLHGTGMLTLGLEF
jgi:hypothetical protein